MATPSSSCSSNTRYMTREFFCGHCNQTLSRSSYYLHRWFTSTLGQKNGLKLGLILGNQSLTVMLKASCQLPWQVNCKIILIFLQMTVIKVRLLLNVQLPCRLVHCDCSPFMHFLLPTHTNIICITLRFYRSSYSSDIIMFCQKPHDGIDILI